MKRELSKRELDLLAKAEKVGIETLKSVRHLLDTKLVLDKLILFEFKEKGKDRRVTKKQIIAELMKSYGVSKSYIEQVVYDSRITHKPCNSCGEPTTLYQLRRNSGICTKCVNNKPIKDNDDK